ncbi:MAG: DUF4920 domain-containing protein [Acidobacteria bacterium]|nr:DUF4920 domain-containing protein [Acidobacteriota bacterium]
MKKILSLIIFSLFLAGAGFAQEKTGEMSHKKPTDADKAASFDANGKIKRGEMLGSAKIVSLAKALKKPNKYAGKTVLVEGIIIRSCKMEGCWMELAPNKDAKSVRVKMKDHAFFIPLDAAGMQAKVEGKFSVKTLSKAEVDHLINEDGAKFDNRNTDGTVTEIAFEATGVELTKK